MKAYVAVTDNDWFRFLKQRPNLDEVNFWQPGGNRLFGTLQPNEPFLFKLHYPDNYIVGGGFFAHSSILPSSLAWDAFGEKNGAATIEQMRERIENNREGRCISNGLVRLIVHSDGQLRYEWYYPRTKPPGAKPGATAPAGPATKLNVSYPDGGAHLPLFLARDKGIFAKYGLDVTLQGLGGGSVASAALIGGDIQIAEIAATARQQALIFDPVHPRTHEAHGRESRAPVIGGSVGPLAEATCRSHLPKPLDKATCRSHLTRP